MGLPTFDKCCFCIELKTGCFIIGYLNLIGTIIMAIISLVLMLAGGVALSVETKDKESQEAAKAVGAVALVMGVIMLIAVVLALAFSIVLLVGLHKDKPGHVKAYLIFSLVFVVIYAISFLVRTISKPVISVIIQDLITLLLNIYFILVIRSQYVVMRDGPKGGPAIYSSA